MPRFKKGSAEAKRYMAKIRNKKHKPKKAKKKKAKISGTTTVKIPNRGKNRSVNFKRNSNTGHFQSISGDLFKERNTLENQLNNYKSAVIKLKNIPAKQRTPENKNSLKYCSAAVKFYKKQLNQANAQIKKHLK